MYAFFAHRSRISVLVSIEAKGKYEEASGNFTAFFFVFWLVASYIKEASRNFRTNHSALRQSFSAFWSEASYTNQKKYIEILGRIKCSDILCSHLVHKRKHNKQWKLKIDERKLRIALGVLLEVSGASSDT